MNINPKKPLLELTVEEFLSLQQSDVLEKTKKTFDDLGIEIPYPHQVEIHKE